MDISAERSPLSERRDRKRFLGRFVGNLGLPAALGAALLVILPLVERVHIAEYDEAVLLDAARNVGRTGLLVRSIGINGVPVLDHTPLYPFLLSLYAPAAGENLFTARAITVMAGLLCVALTYGIGARVGGRAVGFLAALFAALSPFLAVYSYFVRMEMFMVAAMLAAIYLLVRRRPLSMPEFVLADCSLAVACLFKEFAALLALPAALFVWATAPGSIRRRGLAVLAVVGPPAVALAGWGLWAWTLWPAAFAPALQRWLHSAAGGAVNDPRMGVGWVAWSQQLSRDLFRPGLVIGLVVALLSAAARARRVAAAEALLWGYLATAVGFSYLIQLREPRHLVAAIPVAAILTAQGLVSLARAAKPGLTVAKAGLLALAVTLLALAGPWDLAALARGPSSSALAPIYRNRLVDNDRFYGPLAQAGRELRQLSGPDEVVVVAHQGPVVAYYADRHYLMLYTMAEPAIMKALDRAQHLVWDDPTWLALPPDRVPFVEARVAAEFELKQQVGDAPPVIEIYQRKP